MSPFSSALARTPPGPAAVVPRRTNLATDDEMVSSMYARLQLIKPDLDFRQEADKYLRLVQRRYKKDYDSRVRFAAILRIGGYVFLDMPFLLRSAAKQSAAEGYDKYLPLKEGPNKVIGVNNNTIHILQEGL